MEFVALFGVIFIVAVTSLVVNAWPEKNSLERKYLYGFLKSEEKKNGKY